MSQASEIGKIRLGYNSHLRCYLLYWLGKHGIEAFYESMGGYFYIYVEASYAAKALGFLQAEFGSDPDIILNKMPSPPMEISV